jgi:hypothetical protein
VAEDTERSAIWWVVAFLFIVGSGLVALAAWMFGI